MELKKWKALIAKTIKCYVAYFKNVIYPSFNGLYAENISYQKQGNP